MEHQVSYTNTPWDRQNENVALWLQAQGRMAGVSIYASLFEPDITRLDLYNLPKSHVNGPFFPNISRVIGIPQAVALALENSKIVIYQADSDGWTYPREIASKLKWKHQLQIRKIPPSQWNEQIVYPLIQTFSLLKNLQFRSTINRAPRAKEK